MHLIEQESQLKKFGRVRCIGDVTLDLPFRQEGTESYPISRRIAEMLLCTLAHEQKADVALIDSDSEFASFYLLSATLYCSLDS